jgi:hypothetical protein
MYARRLKKMMFWALARVSFSAAKIVSCNNKKYLHNYYNCSTLLSYEIGVFSTKTHKNQLALAEKKISKFSIDQFSIFGLKFFIFS